MARTNTSDVKDILETDLSDSIIQAFIDDANEVVTYYLDGSESLNDSQLESIEKWLSAHLIASTREKQAGEIQVGKTTVSYEGHTGMGLNYTPYGQQVKNLDVTGTLSAKMGKKQADLDVL